jgi:hypothetical protein
MLYVSPFRTRRMHGLIGEDANALAKARREPRGGTMLLEHVQEPKGDGRKDNRGKCKRQTTRMGRAISAPARFRI